MILVLYTLFSTQMLPDAWIEYTNWLPEKKRETLSRFRRWQDRQASLLGRLLLREGLLRFGYEEHVLERIRESPYGRPYLDERVDFNLSHSGQVVVCALTQTGRIGIDVEAIREIDFGSFERYMTPDEWNVIDQSTDPLMVFFQLWTRKESLIKADGRGLSIPLETISVLSKFAEYEGTKWHLTNLTIEKDHPCCLAASRGTERIEMVRMEY